MTADRPAVPQDAPRLLAEDEKWGYPMVTREYGTVRPRVYCQHGGRSSPFACITPATWLVGRKKLCKKHAVGISRD